MTSSDKHLQPGQPYWNYNVQSYKTYDTHSEPGLISVLVLSCGRPEITKMALDSTIASASRYHGDIEWVLLEQGGCEATYQYFMQLQLPRKVVVRQRNYGINNGLNQLWALSRGEYCMIHENDWVNRIPNFNFLGIARQIFEERPPVGIIQLRAIWDPRENWGVGKPEYSPWSCADDALAKANVQKWLDQTASGHKYWIAKSFYGFNNNPCIIRKELYRKCGAYPECLVGTDPRHGETVYQDKVLKTGYFTAHIGEELYYHAGQVPTKGV